MHQQTHAYIVRLTSLLQQHKLWQTSPISPCALQSNVPFCHDTMAFEQWLQFVFIEKIQYIIDQKQPLPRNFAIAPMAQMMLANQPGSADIIDVLNQLDTLLGDEND
ncbi:YqcC family protein [Pseudoalteromonas sp. MMG010]|uniref:YqcC family protein n=1 Tax=Pseudoalteromonas sp. MMG010 TaxID=2822685 RepID=UPI001B3A60CB|nr:YqcC family protein [Pseudoalteromonas sp. MMG010]MBQ4831650.1 YqcC family protein [Pseudoalteromonas sp. MMG010]